MIRMLLAVSLTACGLSSMPADAQNVEIERFTEEGDISLLVEQIVETFERRYPDHPPVAAVPNPIAENIRAMARELAAAQ